MADGGLVGSAGFLPTTSSSRTRPATGRIDTERATTARPRTGRETSRNIAVDVGYAGRQSAKKAYDTALRRWAIKGVQQHRIIQSARLDALWQVAYGAVEAGDLGQVGNCLRIEKRRAELWGLDQPRTHHVQVEPPTPYTKAGDMLIKKLEELRGWQGPLPEASGC